MDFRGLLRLLVIAGFVTLPMSSTFVIGGAQAEKPWEQQVEETFFLGRGMGRQLMTQEEWLAHREKMRTLRPGECEQYREEWHKKMVERARERGITLPETPGPHGKGMGPGGDWDRRGAMDRGYIY